MNHTPEIPGVHIVSSNDDLCRFLLGDTGNSRSLRGDNLLTEVDIVGVGGFRGTGEYFEKKLENAAKTMAQAARKIYRFDRKDAAIYEWLLMGFTQSSLSMDQPLGSSEFAVKIVPAQTSSRGQVAYYPSDEAASGGNDFLSFRIPKTDALAAFNAGIGELEITPPASLHIVNASSAVINALLGEYNEVVRVDGQNRQVRKSWHHYMSLTAIQAPLLLSTHQQSEFYAVPIHRIGTVTKTSDVSRTGRPFYSPQGRISWK